MRSTHCWLEPKLCSAPLCVALRRTVLRIFLSVHCYLEPCNSCSYLQIEKHFVHRLPTHIEFDLGYTVHSPAPSEPLLLLPGDHLFYHLDVQDQLLPQFFIM